MKKLGKKIRMIAIIIAACSLMLTGCGKIDGTEVIATLDGEEITSDLYNFYARYQQAYYEQAYSVYGKNFWDLDMYGLGSTIEDSVKDTLLSNIKTLLILEKYAGDYNVSITDEEQAAITEAAEKFMSDNDEKTLKAMTASQEVVEKVLTLFTVSNKMSDAMIADADTEVTDEEAAQRKIEYVLFSTADTTDDDGNTVSLTDEEIAAKKSLAEELLSAAEDAGNLSDAAAELDDTLTVESATYDADTTTLKDAVKEAADALAEGEFAEVIEVEGTGYYVVQLISEMDEEATETKKETIVKERQSALYTELYEAMEEETEYTVNESIWNKIDFVTSYFTVYAEETESTADESTTDESTADETTAESESNESDESTDESAADTSADETTEESEAE